MGIVGLPSYHDYLDKDELLLNAIKYIMKKILLKYKSIYTS